MSTAKDTEKKHSAADIAITLAQRNSTKVRQLALKYIQPRCEEIDEQVD